MPTIPRWLGRHRKRNNESLFYDCERGNPTADGGAVKSFLAMATSEVVGVGEVDVGDANIIRASARMFGANGDANDGHGGVGWGDTSPILGAAGATQTLRVRRPVSIGAPVNR